MKNLQKGFITPLSIVVIILLVIGAGFYFYQGKFDQEYSNKNYGLSVKYPKDIWVSVNDVGISLLNKETNVERLLTLVKKSPQNGAQCTDANSGKNIPCDSQSESIKFAVINKPINDVKSSIPSFALKEYNGHTGYNSNCAPLNLTKYLGVKPSFCSFSGFEWDEHAE